MAYRNAAKVTSPNAGTPARLGKVPLRALVCCPKACSQCCVPSEGAPVGCCYRCLNICWATTSGTWPRPQELPDVQTSRSAAPTPAQALAGRSLTSSAAEGLGSGLSSPCRSHLWHHCGRDKLQGFGFWPLAKPGTEIQSPTFPRGL